MSFSEKQFGITPANALETDPELGHSMLAYPQKFSGLDRVQTADGKMVDAGWYPFAKAHEDMLVLAGSNTAKIGWSAALAKSDGFLFFAIKDAVALPETLLWMSNGGRHYKPWSSRHDCVLGIEEAATCAHHTGIFSSTGATSPNGLSDGLILEEDGFREIRYGFGAIPVPDGWSEVADIQPSSDSLILTDIGGGQVEIPFAGSHFGL